VGRKTVCLPSSQNLSKTSGGSFGGQGEREREKERLSGKLMQLGARGQCSYRSGDTAKKLTFRREDEESVVDYNGKILEGFVKLPLVDIQVFSATFSTV
jgi:hypothetical protein